MNQSGGVSGPSSHESQQAGGQQAPGDGTGNVGAAFTTPIATMDELRTVLVQNLGEKEGNALFDNFSNAWAMMMFSSTQQAMDHAQQAVKKQRQGGLG